MRSRRCDEQTLNATVPGTYGTIIATLRHIIYCEIDFLERLLSRDRYGRGAVPRQ
jgi:hypothetical protein